MRFGPKSFLIVTAAVEVGAGLVLASWPAVLAWMLFGSPLSTPLEDIIGRIAGVALFSLGVACWLARRDEHSPAAKGLIVSMLVYNTSVVGMLSYAGMVWRLFGVAFWPGVVLHLALATWCIVCLSWLRKRLTEER
jgi:hypothetical protein